MPLARAKAQFAVHQRVAAHLEGLQLLSLRPRFERPGEKDVEAEEDAEVRASSVLFILRSVCIRTCVYVVVRARV